MERYNKWCRKQASTAQCSPALMASALIGGAIIISYVYFNLILRTVLFVLAVVLGLLIAAGIGLLIRQMIRWNKNVIPVTQVPVDDEDRSIASRLRSPLIESDKGLLVQDPKTVAMAADIDTLADDDLELVWAPDGKTLLGRKNRG